MPDFGAYIEVDTGSDKLEAMTLSRQMVLFCVERRRVWRMLQSRAGVENPDYLAQRKLLAAVDSGERQVDELFERGAELIEEILEEAKTS